MFTLSHTCTLRLRLRLFWVKMISGNHFHPFPHVWLQRKIQFSGNCIPVDHNLPLWPGNEFTFSFSLQFISRSLSTHSNIERREKRNTKQTHTQREWELRSLTLPPRPPIQTPRPPIHKPRPPIHKTRAPSPKRNCPKLTRTHCSDLPRAGDAEFSQTITAQTNARSSSTSRSSVQPLRSPSQTLYHGEFSVTGSPSTHSPHLRPTHVRSTHSPHRSDLCIYIYIYIYLYIYLLFFIY